MTEEAKKGKVLKVLYFDDAGAPLGEYKTTQIPEDPFANRGARGLQEPPVPLEQLVFLAEVHPIHSAALDQKVADVVGMGWEWDNGGDDDADDEIKDLLDEWFEDLAGEDQTMHELLSSTWLDYETIGHGLIEIARDASGKVGQLFHVPGHTCRFHRDGVRIAQVRGNKVVWFKRWGSPTDDLVDKRTGAMKKPGEIEDDRIANDMLVIQKPTRRSTWYGIPGYISSIGWISLALAARDDNIMFFQNRREPRWAIVLENLEEDPDLEEDLRAAFKNDLKQPYRNIMIPVQGQGKVTFQKLSTDRADGTFSQLSDRADAQILVSHRLPPERLGMSKVGPLGGNVVGASTRVYKEGVVSPAQTMLAARVNRFIDKEYTGKRTSDEEAQEQEPATKKLDIRKVATGDQKVTEDKSNGTDLIWQWKPVELDLAEDAAELQQAQVGFSTNIITLREARAKIGLGPLMKRVPKNADLPEGQDPATAGIDEDDIEYEEVEDPRNDKLFVEIAGPGAGGTQQPGFGMFGGNSDPMTGEPGLGYDDPTGASGYPDQQLEDIQQSLRELIEKRD